MLTIRTMLPLLALLLPTLALASSETVSLHTPPSQSCAFTFPHSGVSYDLCPHFAAYPARGNVSWAETTPPSVTESAYRWSLAGPLEADGTVMAHNQCPPGTWVCLTVKNTLLTHRSDPPRITRLVPVAGSLVASKNHEEHKGHEDEDAIPRNTDVRVEATYYDKYWDTKDVLTIRLHGGSYVQKPQHALFVFRCDPSASFSSPKYTYNWNGTHIFGWRSKHACPTRVSRGGSGGNEKGGGGKDPEKPPPDDVDGDGKLEGPDVDPVPARPTMGAKTVGWALVMLIAAALAFVLRAPALRLANKHGPRLVRGARKATAWHPLASLFRRFTFRLGERTLVRWAAEEGAYTGVPGDGGGPVFEYDADGDEEGQWLDDEMIPLTPSPGPRSAEFGAKAYAGREVKGYGAA